MLGPIIGTLFVACLAFAASFMVLLFVLPITLASLSAAFLATIFSRCLFVGAYLDLYQSPQTGTDRVTGSPCPPHPASAASSTMS